MIDLTGFLIQGVPSANEAAIDKTQKIQVDGKHFRVADYAVEAIRELLKKPGVRISFMSDQPAGLTGKILDAIRLDAAKTLKNVAHQIVSDEQLSKDSDGKPIRDLARVSSDLSRVVFVTPDSARVPSAQKDNVVPSGSPYFHYESFEAAQKAAEELKRTDGAEYEKKKASFPPDEATWKAHRYRVAPVFGLLNDAIPLSAGPKSPWLGSLQKLRQNTKVQWGGRGLAVLGNQIQVEPRSRGPKLSPQAFCVQVNPWRPGWKKILPWVECKERVTTRPRWTDAKKTQCAEMTLDGAFVGQLEAKDCACNPDEVGYTLKKCTHAKWNDTTVPFDDDGKYIPECAPDTLYSWKKPEYVETYARESKPDRVLPIYGILFTWRTPVGSYGYADGSIRIKLKRKAAFKLISADVRDCDKLKSMGEDVDTTVFVAVLYRLPGYSEYILCSSGPVESWSYGTEEHLREMEREKKWVAEHKPGEYDFLKQLTKAPWGDDQSCGMCQFDSRDWTLGALEKRFQMMKDLVSEHKGQIFYSAGAEPNRQAHFDTKAPSYFNPCPGQ